MNRPRGMACRVISRWLAGSWCAVCLLGGCQMFSWSSGKEATRTAQKSLLSPLGPSQESIQLDVLLVDRRADDPLLGPLLWHEVDQVGAVPVETRDLLQQNGLQVGHVGAKPPAAMLKLLGLVPEIETAASSRPGKLPTNVNGRTYSVHTGTDTEIQVSDHLPDCNVRLVETKRTREMHYDQARCVLSMTAVRMQDGWVRVEFLPEIHHGEQRLRQMATDAGWAMRGGQAIDACQPQKFSLMLNVGESAVITAAPASEGTLGDVFFRRDQEGELRQRALIVRLSDMGRAKPAMK